MSNYIIYDKLSPFLSLNPFLTGKTILSELYIANQSVESKEQYIDFNLCTLANPSFFIKNYSKIFENASLNNETIIALEDSTYLSLTHIKEFFLSSDEESAKYANCDVEHINNIIMKDEYIKAIKSELKHSFKNFSAEFYIGNNVENRFFCNEKIEALFDAIELNRIKMEYSFHPNGYDIYEYNEEIAKKIAGKVLFDAFDNGADFLIVSDIRTFTFFDTYQKKIAKTFGRDINLPILTLSQVVLMALGITDTKALCFDKHFIKPTLL